MKYVDEKLFNESGFDIHQLDFDVSAFHNEKSDRANAELDKIIKQLDKLTDGKCLERPVVYIGPNEDILRDRNINVLVYLEEVMPEMENFVEVVNQVDRCRIVCKPKEAVLFNDINLFNRYSTRGAGSIKVILCKYEYDTRKKT